MNIYVLGVGTTRFGELWDVSPRSLVKEAVDSALSDAQIGLDNIDAIYVGNMLSGMLGNQENIGALYAEELGVSIPAFKIEGACASGGLAVHNGISGLMSGLYERVLVIGVEKMTDHAPGHVATALMAAGSEGERIAGLTFPGLYGLMAKAYMSKYKLSERDMAAVSVKNHYHGSLNENAHFQKRISVDQVMESASIADPLKLLDCSPISDGASAIVLSNEDHKKSIVQIVASSVATDSLGLHDRSSLTSLNASKLAGVHAFKEAALGPTDIDVAEVHDCFSIAEIMALEDLDFYKKGKSAKAISHGKLTLGSSDGLVVNTSGGLKACGHPVGATGVKQIVEIAQQLRGTSGARQVENARIGLTHNVGGSGAVAAVHILQTANS